MYNPGKAWWGYVKSMIRRYPEKVNRNERRAVQLAIEHTGELVDGGDRLEVVCAVLINQSHKLEGAAMLIPCSYETAQRWHADFILEVAKNFRCNGLV